MMRGIRFLLSLLLVLGMPAAALASHFIPMECVFVKIPDTSSKVVQKDFSEGERKMHFLGGRSSNGSPVLLTVRKGHFLEPDSSLWHNVLNDSVSRSRRITYSITQFKDTDTGRFFYGITPGVSGTNWLFNTMLIGYDREGKKVHEFINSRNFYAPRGVDLDAFKTHRGNLYLAKYEFGRFQDGTVYRLIWNPEKDWFGYEEVSPGEVKG